MSSELSGGEKRFIHDLEGVDPDFVLWVKKTNKKEVIQDRLFVLTKYRIYSIKRNKIGGKKQVQRQGHLYDLVEIRTDDIDRVVLKFTTFSIDISGASTGITIPKVLINAFHRISFTFSQEASPNLIILPTERASPEIEQVDPGLAHGFFAVYKAQCNYYSTPVNMDLIDYIEDTVSKGSRDFCLDDFAGIDKNSESAVNLTPVLAALRHNTFFDTFICHNKTRKEVPGLLADVFVHNKTITRIDLQGIEAEEGWVQLGDSLKENQFNQLYYMNISDNLVHDKGMISIANAIKSFNRPFYDFKASNVSFQSKGAVAFFKSFQQNYESSGSIRFMDYSRNQFDRLGSESLHDWLILYNSSNPQPKKPLVQLNLDSTLLDTAKVTHAIKQGCVESLELLDLSNNKFTPDAVQNLCNIITKSDALATLKLRHCGLIGEQIISILNACSAGVPVHERMLDLSDNNLGKAGALIFAPAIKTCSNIHFLKLAQNSFRKRGITYILQALEENDTLRAIDLSSNFKNSSKAEATVDQLARIIHKHPTIEKLILSGKDKSGFFLGKELLPLVKSLTEDCKLVELDISGNSMGDDVCRELFETLKKNTSLRTLHIDNNALGVAGFQAMKRCFTTNRTLIDIPVPTTDITRILGQSKDRKAVNDKIGEILADVNTCLANNKNGIAYSDLPSSTKTTVAISSSTPCFRASTYSSNQGLGEDLQYSNGSNGSVNRVQSFYNPSTTSNNSSSHSTPNHYTTPPPPPLVTPPSNFYSPPPPPPPSTDDHHYSNGATTYDDQNGGYYNNYDQQTYDNNGYHDDQQQHQNDQQQYYDENGYDQSTATTDYQQHDDQQYQQYDSNNDYQYYDDGSIPPPPPPPQ
eukprot:gene4857-6053_t